MRPLQHTTQGRPPGRDASGTWSRTCPTAHGARGALRIARARSSPHRRAKGHEGVAVPVVAMDLSFIMAASTPILPVKRSRT